MRDRSHANLNTTFGFKSCFPSGRTDQGEKRCRKVTLKASFSQNHIPADIKSPKHPQVLHCSSPSAYSQSLVSLLLPILILQSALSFQR